MFRDSFDRLLLFALALVVAALAGLLAAGSRGGEGRAPAALDRAMEREMAYQARLALLQKLYGPAEALRREGQPQAALLRLDELARAYPGEAHGHILKGEILHQMGALEEAAASLVAGVRLSGDYVDEKSPLSRRTVIRQVVEQGLAHLGERSRLQPGSPSLAAARDNVRYLQSRLAGGCE